MLLPKPQCIIFCTLFLGSSLMAQEKFEWKDATSGGYSYRYVTNDPMKARFYTLKNGLTVILTSNHKEPRIRTLIGVRAGSNNDPKDHTGLAHYLEHLLFKGTYRFGSIDSVKEKVYIHEIEDLYDVYNQTTDTAERKRIYRQIDSVSGIAAKYAIGNEYDKMMSAMGSQGTNAHTTMEETVYEEDIPANAVDKFLAVQAERFSNPIFRLFHTELEAVYEEKNRGLDNDYRNVRETMLSALFPTHNYGQQTVLGTVEHLKNPSLKAIRAFYNAYYVPGNMAIVMSGDLDPDVLIKKIDKAFAYMAPKEVKEYKGTVEKPITSPIVKEVSGPEAEFIQIGFRLPGVQSYRSLVVATLVSQLLSNGKAGLIDINLNKQQKVLSASADVQYMRDYSLFMLTGKAKDGQTLEQVQALLLSQLNLLASGAFDESLIRAIAANFKLYELTGLDNNNNRAGSLMDAFILHRGKQWNNDVAFVDDMGKVTKQQVVDFVNEYLHDNYVAVFKRKGEKENLVKVEKPPITPVEVNRGAESDFLKHIQSIPAGDIQPRWIDYDKEIGRAHAGKADVLYVRNKDNDLFRLHYRIDMGTWNDRKLSLAAAYLQYLGDDKRSAEEISRAFYNIACNFSVAPASEYTDITISGLQENFAQAVQLFENLVRHCRPDETALHNLTARWQKARTDAKLNKSTISRGLANYAIYGPENPFNYQLSNEEIQSVTAAELVDFLHGLFDYRHTIMYYGPLSLNAFVPQITKLHPVPGGFKPVPLGVKFEKQDQLRNTVLFAPYDMVQSEITWVSNSDTYDTSRIPVVQLFNNYFGGGMTSVVFQTIRESKALAYSTYAYYAPPAKKEDRFTTIAYVGSQADKMMDAVEAMNQLLTDLPHTEALFAAAKESIRKDIASERITQDGIIFNYLSAKRLGLSTDFRKSVYEKISRLSFDDMKDFYTETIAGKPYTYCVIGSPEKIDLKALEKIGPVKQLSLEEIFGY